jgi:hypothetical protein
MIKSGIDMSNTWPALYLFKFIVPTEKDNIARVELAFDCMGAAIKTRKSKQLNSKYISRCSG